MNPPQPHHFSFLSKFSIVASVVLLVGLGGAVYALQQSQDVRSRASVSAGIVSGQVYRLINKCSNKALDVKGASLSNSALLQQWTWTGGKNQQFRISESGAGYYTVTAIHSGKRLNVKGASTANSVEIIQYNVGSVYDNERWKINYMGDGYYQLLAKHSGKALEVAGKSTLNGARVQQYPDYGSCGHRWRIESMSPVPTAIPTRIPTVIPTRTPTAVPTSIFRTIPTSSFTPSATSMPNVTAGPIVGVSLELTLSLHGIGSGGDKVNPNGQGNLLPIHQEREVSVDIYNSLNQLVVSKTGRVNFDTASGKFKGTVALESSIQTGAFIVKVKTPQYLRANVPGIQNLVNGQLIQLPNTALIVGDINNDNQINIADHNILMGCYSSILPAVDCEEGSLLADINDDGYVNQYDYNLFLRELYNQ